VVQPHVWVAQRVMIIKSPRIGYGSVIGAMSCVTRAIPPKSLAAGAPAKVIRDNITWDRADRPSQRTIDLIRSLDQIAPIDDFCETL
jgi:acetyltransferase-like isoleucine patch superfamily enzyme